jgi:RimJ/RimL family protein N-acetyltransferase
MNLVTLVQLDHAHWASGFARLRRSVCSSMNILPKRLGSGDALAFHNLRLEGFRLEDRAFRFDPEDELHESVEAVRERIERDFVSGAFVDGELIGIAGFARFSGLKLAHKGLLWGMYVRTAYRGTGVAEALIKSILDHAGTVVEVVTLTVMKENLRAVRFYQRCGFSSYGVEPLSVKLRDGTYLDEVLMMRPTK